MHTRFAPERIPAKWNRFADKDVLQSQWLEQIPIAKVPNTFAGFALALLATTAATPAFAADIAAQSKVDAVTVFPSGAEVTRAAEARIEAGEHTLIFDQLPGDLMPETIRVEGLSDAKVEIGSVDSRVVHVPAMDSDARRKALEAEIRRLQDERAQLEQAIADAEYQKSLMQQLASNAFAPPTKDGPGKSFGAADLGQLLDLVGSKLQILSKFVLDSRTRQREIDEAVSEISKQIGQLAPQAEARTRVSVHLSAPAAASGTFRVKYRIANAGWQPIYDARLSSPDAGTKARVELVRRAAVEQSTTESWENVALTLSTARPVGATAAPDILPQRIDRFDETRAGSSTEPADALEAPAPATMAVGEVMQDAAKADEIKKVKQLEADVEMAGFQALYAIPGRVSVDNTGTAKNVRIDTTVADAKISARTVPKLDPNAYLTASFTLSGDSPALPGVAMLYRDGVFMGQGRLPMLSPGEEVKLGFGADDLIKVKRVEVNRQTGEEGIINTSKTDVRAYDITVKNLHAFAVPVTVLDQMPYSTMEDIVVGTLPGMTPPSARDFEKKRGVLAWDFNLDPQSEKLTKHGFKITWPKDVRVGLDIN